MQSPRKAGRTKKSALLTPEQFKAQTEAAIKAAKELDKLAKEVLRNKGKPVVAEGKEFNIKKINTLKTANYRELLRMPTAYRRTFGRVKADRVGTINGGFRQALLVGPVLEDFFRRADLGNVGGRNDAVGPSIQTRLPFLQEGQAKYATRSILTSLFALYAKRHSLSSRATDNQGKSVEQQNFQLLGVDDLMNQALNPLLAELEQSSRKKLADAGKQDGQPKPALTKAGKQRKYRRDDGSINWNDYEHAFNRNNFSYSALQSIFNQGIDTLTLRLPTKDESPYFVHDADLARAYMAELDLAKSTAAPNDKKSSLLGTAGYTPAEIAARAVARVPTSSAQDQSALQLAAALDTVHALIQAASATYSVVRPKKPSKKPRRVAVAAVAGR